MTLRERLEWLGRITLLVFILASAAFLSAITAMRIAIHGRDSNNAESRGQECFRGEPDAAVAGAGAARG